MKKLEVVLSCGRIVNLYDLRPEDITIDHIARSLANQCRYNGAVRRYYSVAEHSVILAEYNATIIPPEARIHLLMHDAREAYFSDITSPVKNSPIINQENLKELDDLVQGAINKKYGLDYSDHVGELVDLMDNVIVAHEMRFLYPAGSDAHKYWDATKVLFGPFAPRCGPEEAYKMFLRCFNSLRAGENVSYLSDKSACARSVSAPGVTVLYDD